MSTLRGSTAALVVLAGAACTNNQLPVGVAALVVYVEDMTDLAPLCDATVVINGEPAQQGGTPDTHQCYFLPTSQLAVGSAFTVTGMDTGYGVATTSGTVATTGSKVFLQLPRLGDGGPEAGSPDASADAPGDGPVDADDASDANEQGDG